MTKALQLGGGRGRLQQALPLAGATGSWQSGPFPRWTLLPLGDVGLEILSLSRPFPPPRFVPFPWHPLGQFLVVSIHPNSEAPQHLPGLNMRLTPLLCPLGHPVLSSPGTPLPTCLLLLACNPRLQEASCGCSGPALPITATSFLLCTSSASHHMFIFKCSFSLSLSSCPS